jgi:aspartyl protease family protein
MAFSSGTKSLLGEALGWAGAALIMVLGLSHYDEVKGFFGAAIGLPAPGQTPSAERTRGNEPDAAQRGSGGGFVELEAGANGHFHAEAEVNGRPIQVMVDTGASLVALTYEDAEAAGIFLRDKDFTHRVSTANGVARVAPVRLSRVAIGDIVVRDVDAAVCEHGKLETTLLGMSFLSRLERFDMRAGRLILED